MSLALVREDGESRYWVIPDIVPIDPWVAENVVPILYKMDPMLVETEADMSREIARFLKHDEDPTIIADWPDDIKYFCDVMVFGPGKCRNIRSCKFEFNRDYGNDNSEILHNALADAFAIKDSYYALREE
jgi:hypothetical protein